MQEKQIVVLCSNLGILSASVLSIIPLICPYRWQSLLMPILADDMLDFLDAPVPYIKLHLLWVEFVREKLGEGRMRWMFTSRELEGSFLTYENYKTILALPA
ncbi:PREDICTED: DENN domain-containing protein 1C-like isoform X2 [Populus euphratica]|uniref:DENN domain-containing protein 1C-like isoform X2 n=1 Tax=Populus euphratica TaxID=75702 RepID=A0AAJ6X8S8_POPEU|nr:PREDICTED: DENN domain-containing protein 1C-like isoform X2 [Populus euphratica]